MKRTVGIVDYGMGNIRSVAKALESLGAQPVIVRQSDEMHLDAYVLPGVGAFGAAMKNLKEAGLSDGLSGEVLEKKKPFLGICLGMHLIFDDSQELGFYQGLGWLKGHVKKMPARQGQRLPHMGWNAVTVKRPGGLFDGMEDGDDFYFVHSFYVDCGPSVVTSEVDYGGVFAASVQQDHIFATQFHPEKSSAGGLRVLRNFLEATHRC